MSTEKAHHIQVAGLDVEVVRKAIKNLHIAVYPPAGHVRVAAPRHVGDEAVRLAVITRLGWIRRQQKAFAAQERQPEREHVSGESHYYRGRRYRLRIHEARGAARVELRTRTFIDLYVPPGTGAGRRERVLDAWYRARLKEELPDLVARWSAALGLDAPAWGVKRMKTKWGTCSTRSRRIWINLELIKKPSECLEYVVLHELAHMLERSHGDRFTALLDRHLPMWRRTRSELNELPLGPNNWDSTQPLDATERDL